MAGNPGYILYTLILIISLPIIALVIGYFKGWRSVKKFLMIALPFVIIIQLYYWNLEVNKYVKSFIFPSLTYECTFYEMHQDIKIPLYRTVLLGKQDFCDPFYRTYIDSEKFITFYEDKLKELKKTQEIEHFTYIKEKNGFIVTTPDSTVEILFKYKGNNNFWIIVHYVPLSYSG